MSGLDIDKEHILEMACLVTDTDLNVVAEVIYSNKKQILSVRDLLYTNICTSK